MSDNSIAICPTGANASVAIELILGKNLFEIDTCIRPQVSRHSRGRWKSLTEAHQNDRSSWQPLIHATQNGIVVTRQQCHSIRIWLVVQRLWMLWAKQAFSAEHLTRVTSCCWVRIVPWREFLTFFYYCLSASRSSWDTSRGPDKMCRFTSHIS